MLKTDIKLLLGLFIVGLIPSHCHPMIANQAAKRVGVELVKKGIEKGTSALHWAIAAGPCWIFPVEYLISLNKPGRKEWIEEIQIRASAQSREKFQKNELWIRNELKKLGYADWNVVELFPGPGCGATNLLHKKLIQYDELIDQAMDEQNSYFHSLRVRFGFAQNEAYHRARGVLGHEVAHLEKQHIERFMISAMTLPFITHFLCQKMAISKKPSNFTGALGNTLKIARGIPKMIINLAGLWYCSYLAEKEADEGVENDPKVLQAMVRLMTDHSRTLEETGNISLKNRLDIALDVHPHPVKRAQRFEERAAQLRAAQQKV